MVKPIIVTISDSHLNQMGGVVDALTDAGMSIDNIMGGVGIVTGSIDAALEPKLLSIAGVDAVEPDREAEIR